MNTLFNFSTNFQHDLTSLSLPQDAVVMVHSSLKSFGQVPGGADTVITALIDYLSPSGTLLMPGLSYLSVQPDNPVFNVCQTPSCVGLIPETFRKINGVKRSLHPTHSVCGIGKQAEKLLKTHYKDNTPCGPNSPFHLLPKANGYILMLGCGLKPNTSMHAVEELIEPPYLYGDPLQYTLIDEEGNQTKKEYMTHNFTNTVQRYDRIAMVMDAPGLRSGKVCGAECFLIQTPALWQATVNQYRENPFYFVDSK